MREKNRINRICEKLKKVWLKNQDLRLGQLMEDFIFEPKDMFYQEDDETELNLDKQSIWK